MAASSPVVEGYHSHSHFVEGYLSHFVDLQHVNRRLQWNPFYEDRLSTRFDWQHAKEPLFESARKIVEYYAEPLTKYEEGRTIMDAEDPGEYAPDPHYWRERANFYKATYERLQKEPIYSESRSPTPDVFRPWMFDETELGQAKGHATHAAGLLATVPGGTALLEAEDHGDSATDPEYWRGKKKYYEAKFTALYQTTTLERAKLYVDAVARRLATFAAGKALLEAEDHGDHATDPEYWRSKRDYYRDEYSRLRKDFWKCWKSRYLEGGVSYFQPTFDPEPKPRARQISVVTESSSTRITGSSTQREKGTDRLSLKTIMSSSNSARWSKKEKDARSVERRKRKDKYRRQKGYEMEPKPPSPPLSCSAIQSPPNGFGTPKSNESQAQRQVIGRRCRDSIQKQQQTHEVANQSPRGGQKRSHMQLPNPYITPSSPDHSVVTAQQRRKRKNTLSCLSIFTIEKIFWEAWTRSDPDELGRETPSSLAMYEDKNPLVIVAEDSGLRLLSTIFRFPPPKKSVVTALTRAHLSRVSGDVVDDFVEGKGQGLIALLHGPPEVDKTSTVEGLSKYLERPLYAVSQRSGIGLHGRQ